MPLATEYDVHHAWNILSYNGRLRWMLKKDNDIRGGTALSEDALHAVAQWSCDYCFNCYVALNPDISHKARINAEDVLLRRYVLFDYDPTTDPEETEPQRSELLFENAPEGHLIFTGRGFHIWSRLDKDIIYPPHERLDDTKRVNELLRKESRLPTIPPGFVLDTRCSDLPRVVRLPGTINWRSHKYAYFIHISGNVNEGLYNDIYSWTPPPAIDMGRPQGTSIKELWSFLNGTSKKFLNEGAQYPGRHDACYTTVKTLQELGAEQEDVLKWASLGAEKCQPPLELSYVKYCVRRVFKP